jgi:SAM-dependent methyltransferase
MATSLEAIKANHVERYRFAATIARGAVLDAACGCGYGSAILADAGCRVRGVDVSEEAIAFARQHWARPSVVYTCADARVVPSGGYDWIVSLETIEHVEDDGGLLRAFARQAPRLLASVPNEAVGPHARADNPFHFRHYTPRELDSLLRGAGWRAARWWSQPWRTNGLEPGVEGATLVVEAVRA